MDFHQIKKIFSNFTNGDNSYAQKGIRPDVYWAIVLGSFIVFLAFIFIFAVSLYLSVEKGDLVEVSQDLSGGETKINTLLLKRVVDDSDNRETTRQDLLNTILPRDPSL